VRKLSKVVVHDSWQEIIDEALASIDAKYLDDLLKSDFFPKNFLSPFSTLSLKNTKYILFGQDPYPREASATGYAFIDGAVKSLWSERGLSKEVNSATSLRNFMKMLLHLDSYEIEQKEIAKLDKSDFIESIFELRDNFEKNGVLLLNIVPVFTTKVDSSKKRHLKYWREFLKIVLNRVKDNDIELILFGNWAKDEINRLNLNYQTHEFEHPYNISFIKNERVKELFSPMKLLYKN